MTVGEWLRANAALLPNQIAGIALLGVAIWLLLFHARAASTRHFAGFLLGYGAAIVLSSVALAQASAESVLRASASVAFFYGATALLLCVLSFPRPAFAELASPRVTLVPAAVGLLASLGFIVGGDPADAYSYAVGIGNALIACCVAIAFVRLAREPLGEARRSLLLLTVGVSLQETYFTTFNVTLVTLGAWSHPLEALVLWGNVAAILIVLAGAARLVPQVGATNPALARTARIALIGIPIGAATGIVSAFYASNAWVANLGAVWRLVFVALVTWGILRHQFLGVDLRVRWAIGRSTVAAAFIAVFFMASEGAQLLFGGENEWAGLLAAGALVFAISPLQRAAERLAEKAVPDLEQPEGAGAHDSLAIYRTALEMAMSDGSVTRDEERKLARIAHGLGLTPVDILEVRESVEGRTGKEVR